LQKVRFLQDFHTFKKDSYRVILAEDELHYGVQINLHSDEKYWLNKGYDGVLFVVVDRS